MERHLNLDSKVHGANMGPIWGQQDPGGPHVGHMNFVIWDIYCQDTRNIDVKKHYSVITKASQSLKSPVTWLFIQQGVKSQIMWLFLQQLLQANTKGNTKTPHFWLSLRGIYLWIPITKNSYAENIDIYVILSSRAVFCISGVPQCNSIFLHLWERGCQDF